MGIRNMLSVFAVLVTILLNACGRPDTGIQPIIVGNTPTSQSTNIAATIQSGVHSETYTTGSSHGSAPASVAGTGSYIVDASLKESIAHSEIIVIGEVIGVGEMFNSHRDVQDQTKPARDTFGVGQEYVLQVQRYLKGSGPDVLTIVQTEGAVWSPPESVTQTDIERARAAQGVPQFEKGKLYLLLLKSLAAYHPEKAYYAGQGLPWRFALAPDGTGVMEAPSGALASIPQDFIPRPDAPLIPQIEQLIQAETNATPTQ